MKCFIVKQGTTSTSQQHLEDLYFGGPNGEHLEKTLWGFRYSGLLTICCMFVVVIFEIFEDLNLRLPFDLAPYLKWRLRLKASLQDTQMISSGWSGSGDAMINDKDNTLFITKSPNNGTDLYIFKIYI